MLVAKIKRFLGFGLLLALALGISTNYLWAAEAAGGGGGGGHDAGGGAGDVNPYAALSQAEKDAKLIDAAEDDSLEKARLLLGAGADVNAQNLDGKTALTMAVIRGHVEVVRLLLAAGADVNVQDQNGYSALMFVALAHHVEILQLLLAAGAGVNVQNINGNSALMMAARNNHVEVVRLLLAAGADVNVQDQDGYSALTWAAFRGHGEVIQLLLANGANVNVQDRDGSSVLILAAYGGSVKIVQLLLAAGAEIPAAGILSAKQNAIIQTALAELEARKTEFLAAAEAGNLAKINELIDLPTRGDRKLVINQALLALAGSETDISVADFERILAILLAHGADIDFSDTIETGGFREAKGAAAASISAASDTALELAIMTNVPNRVDALLMAGANPEKLSESIRAYLANASSAADLAIKEIAKMIENANLARAMLISPEIFQTFTQSIEGSLADEDNTLDPALRYLFQWEEQENDRKRRAEHTRMLATPLPPDED